MRHDLVGPVGGQLVGKGQHIAHQVLDAVGLHALGLARQAIAALVGRNGVIAVGEGGQDVGPAAGVLWKTVQEKQ